MSNPESTNPPTELSAAPPPTVGNSATTADPGRWRQFKLLAFLTGALVLCFSWPLYELVGFAFHSQLYSYVLLVPAVSLYLAWLKRRELTGSMQPALGLASALAVLGLGLLVAYWTARFSGWKPDPQDRLCVLTLAFVSFLWAGCALLLGISQCRILVFPLLFLIFLAPLPLALETAIETFLQHTSAEAAYVMIWAVGTPVFRTGTLFQMPGLSIEVAPQCSGIHSSLVLFITALVGGQVLLNKRWTRILLALFVVPLGILRNGFRVFTLAELSLHYDPNIIDSPLHHRGGPVFFVLSLIPFFIFVWILVKLDRRRRPPPTP